MRYIASRNYQRFFVAPLRRKKKWKLLEYGERSSEMTTTAAATLAGQSRALEWKEQRREPEKGWREEGSERGIAERRVSSFVYVALKWEGAKGMKAEETKKNQREGGGTDGPFRQ